MAKDSLNNLIPVTAASHPFRVERVETAVERGSTIDEIMAAVQPNPALRRYAVVEVGGVAVPQHWWPYLRPHSSVMIRTLPAGGGDDKDPIRIILLIAVTVVSSGIASGTYLGATTGASVATGATVGSVALGAAVAIAGRALINQIAPPPEQDDLGGGDDDKRSNTYSIEAARNRVNRYGPVPRVMGRHRFVPPYAAKPYTEVQGESQYLRALFLWGHGRLDVTDIKIGDTPIDEFDDYEIETVGDNTDDDTTRLDRIFPNSVDERDLSIVLNNSDDWVQRTTDDVADEISVDIVFPRGLFELDNSGDRNDRTVVVSVEYAEAGTNNWQGPELTVGSQSIDIPVPEGRTINPPRGGGTRTYTRYQKFLVVIHRFTGEVDLVGGSAYNNTGQPFPAAPPWGYAIAAVSVNSADGIESVTNLSPDGVTGFSASEDSGDTVAVASGTVTKQEFAVTEGEAKAVRRSLTFKTGDGSLHYDVRLRRETQDNDGDSDIYDEVAWSKLRSIQTETPVQMEHVALTALRIKATDQLNGPVDEVNGLCQAVMPEYDTVNDVWVNAAAATSPAAAFRNVLEGRANGRAVDTSRIDLPALENWAEFTVSRGLEFHHVFDYDTSVTEALNTIASVGRASKAITDGLWTVTVDEPKSTVVQHFTPRNSANFQAEKMFGEKVHALRVRFLNADKGYRQDEIVVFNDGYTEDGSAPDETPPFPDSSGGYTAATVYDGIQLRGVTSEAQAFNEGRYHLAVDQLRPEVYTFETDVEHLVATRGDLVRATHDVPEWGTGYGRVKSVSTDSSGNVDEFTLDASIDLVGGTDYVVRFRTADGTTNLVDVDNPVGDTSTDTFTPSSPISTDLPAVGDLAMVGISGQESVQLIVKSIEPTDELGAKLTCLDYSPAIHDSYDESIPSFNPRMTDPVPFAGDRPPVPNVESLQSDEGVLIRNPDGTVSARLVVTFNVPSDNQAPAQYVQIRYRKSSSDSAYEVKEVPTDAGQITVTDVDQGDAYHIDIRSVARSGLASLWHNVAASHVVVGTSSRPPDVTGFEIEIISQSVYLRWDRVSVFDLDHYEVRFSPSLTGVTWGSAGTLRDDVSKEQREIAVPGRVGTYLIKAVDRGGRKSENAADVVSTATDVVGLNVVTLDTEDSAFDGRFNKTTINGSALELIESSTDVVYAEGRYLFDDPFDLGARYTSRLTSNVQASGNELTNVLSSWATLSGQDPIGGGNAEDWNVAVEVAISDNDPSPATLVDSLDASSTNDGTMTNGPRFRADGPTDAIDQSLEFLGTDEFVDLGTDFGDPQQFTIEFWLKHGNPDVSSSDDARHIVRAGEDFIMLEQDGSISFRVPGVDTSLFTVNAFNRSGSEFGDWVHVACTYDQSDRVIVIDGSEAGRDTIGSGTVSLGTLRLSHDSSNVLDGLIADARFWSAARTETEVDDNRNDRLTGSETDLLAYYRCDDAGYEAWRSLTLGDFTARTYDFRAVLSTTNTAVTPSVTGLEVEIDMQDRVEGADEVVVSGGTLAVQYDPAFKERPALGFTAEDLNAGEYVRFVSKSRTGFTLEIRQDSDGTLVSGDRTLTWVAKGFGKEVT